MIKESIVRDVGGKKRNTHWMCFMKFEGEQK